MQLNSLYTGVKEYFDKCAPHYGMIHIDMPFIDSWQFDNLLETVDTSNAPTVLDLGTGDGNLLLHIGRANKNCRLIGIDLSNKMIEVARLNLSHESLKADFYQQNMEQLPLQADSVDYVVSNGALHHVEDKESLYSEILRVLKPGGKMFVIDGFDILDDEYLKIQSDLKKMQPEFWEGYLYDYNRYMSFLQKELPPELADHPVEFHVPPFKLKKLLESIGFRNTLIKPSPNHIAIYIGEK